MEDPYNPNWEMYPPLIFDNPMGIHGLIQWLMGIVLPMGIHRFMETGLGWTTVAFKEDMERSWG